MSILRRAVAASTMTLLALAPTRELVIGASTPPAVMVRIQQLLPGGGAQ